MLILRALQPSRFAMLSTFETGDRKLIENYATFSLCWEKDRDEAGLAFRLGPRKSACRRSGRAWPETRFARNCQLGPRRMLRQCRFGGSSG